MNRIQHKEKLLQFLDTIRIPHKTFKNLDDDESLIKAGLIDSLAVLQIIIFLEENYNINFQEKGIDPGELNSVNKILDLIERCVD